MMSKKIFMKIKYFLILLVLGLYSCQKEIKYTGTVANPRVNIYVAGFEYNGTHTVAEYWKNGKPVILTDTSDFASASGIAFSGNDVYIVGDEENKILYWKNDSNGYVILPSFSGRGLAITLSGNDVYASGWHYINGK